MHSVVTPAGSIFGGVVWRGDGDKAQYSLRFKTKVALEAVRGERPSSRLVCQFQLHRWKSANGVLPWNKCRIFLWMFPMRRRPARLRD